MDLVGMTGGSNQCIKTDIIHITTAYHLRQLKQILEFLLQSLNTSSHGRIIYITTFVTPVMGHWLEWKKNPVLCPVKKLDPVTQSF